MANKYTKLFINNQEIDLFKSEDLPLNITRRVNSLDGKVQGDYSRAAIKVPATKNNIDILGSSRSFKLFRIEVDGAPSFNGTARIRKGRTYSQGYAAIKETYEINLVSNNSSWFVLLGDTLLSELTETIVTFDNPDIETGFVSEPSIRDWCFLLIKYKNWATVTGTPPDIRYIISIYDSTPALFIKPLVLAAFASIGYTVESQFFETDLFSKLILPTKIPSKLSQAYNDEYLNTVVSLSGPITSFGDVKFPFNVIDVAPPQNPTAYDVTTGLYTAPLDGYYKVKIRVVMGATPPTPPFANVIVFQVNGVDVLPFVAIVFTNVAPGPYYPPPGSVHTAETIVFLSAGDTMDWRLGGAPSVTVDSATWEITGETVSQIGLPIDFKYLLRDWSFSDMLKGLTAIFNLQFETDDNARIVYIEPADGYLDKDRVLGTSERKEGFYRTLETKDYSQLIDYKRKGIFEFPNVKGQYDFKYTADSEETIEFLEGVNALKIYEAIYKMGSGSDTSKTENKEVPFFKKTIHTLDNLAKFPDTNVIPQFPLIYPTNYVEDPTATENDEEYGPRILYFAGQRFGYEDLDGQIELDVNSPNPSLVPMAFMVNYNDTTGLDPNIGFNTELINGQNSIGCLENYYLQSMTRLDKGEVRENYVQFNSIDNLNFSFRLKAFIDGQKYVVQEIEAYNPLKDTPTNFKFVLDIFPTQEEIDKIINSPINSVVSLTSEIP